MSHALLQCSMLWSSIPLISIRVSPLKHELKGNRPKVVQTGLSQRCPGLRYTHVYHCSYSITLIIILPVSSSAKLQVLRQGSCVFVQVNIRYLGECVKEWVW